MPDAHPGEEPAPLRHVPDATARDFRRWTARQFGAAESDLTALRADDLRQCDDGDDDQQRLSELHPMDAPF